MPTLRQLRDAGQVRVRFEGEVAVTDQAGGTVLVRANPMRVALTVVNHEANAANVTRSKVPTTTTGVPVDALRGSLVEDLEGFGKTLGDERRAIFATAAGNLYVEELEAYLLPGQNLEG